jgi:hypothetical protein
MSAPAKSRTQLPTTKKFTWKNPAPRRTGYVAVRREILYHLGLSDRAVRLWSVLLDWQDYWNGMAERTKKKSPTWTIDPTLMKPSVALLLKWTGFNDLKVLLRARQELIDANLLDITIEKGRGHRTAYRLRKVEEARPYTPDTVPKQILPIRAASPPSLPNSGGEKVANRPPIQPEKGANPPPIRARKVANPPHVVEEEPATSIKPALVVEPTRPGSKPTAGASPSAGSSSTATATATSTATATLRANLRAELLEEYKVTEADVLPGSSFDQIINLRVEATLAQRTGIVNLNILDDNVSLMWSAIEKSPWRTLGLTPFERAFCDEDGHAKNLKKKGYTRTPKDERLIRQIFSQRIRSYLEQQNGGAR